MMVAAEIPVTDMKIIAVEYMKLPKDLVDKLVAENEGDDESL